MKKKAQLECRKKGLRLNFKGYNKPRELHLWNSSGYFHIGGESYLNNPPKQVNDSFSYVGDWTEQDLKDMMDQLQRKTDKKHGK